MLLFVSHSEEDTEAFAEGFAKTLKAGAVLALRGGMGAGKTAFVRGLARGLDVGGEVASPTFALVHEHEGAIPLFHFDMYRVTNYDDLYSTGFFDYLDSGAILAVEWSENIPYALPSHTIRVTLTPLSETAREILIETPEEPA